MDFADQAVRGALITYEGEVTWPAPRPEQPPTPPVQPQALAEQVVVEKKKPSSTVKWLGYGALASGVIAMGLSAPPSFLSHFTVFILACFVGWQVIWNVSPSLHTPLMSVDECD